MEWPININKNMNNIKYYLDRVAEIFAEEQFVFEPHELYEPIDYTLRLGGKRIRPTLLLAANGLFGGNEEQVRDAALGIETFHNFTLLHDDLMDRSPLRRGQPTVYTKWGDNAAILSGDTMFALAWRYFLRQPSPRLQEILQCFNETAIEVCEGQQKDMNFENMTLDQVSLADYMVYAGAPQSETTKLYDFGIHTGLAFQIQDDLLDGYGDTAVFGKKTGQDIRDNKKSYLPLAALKLGSAEQKKELAALFSAKDNMDEDKKVRRVLELYNTIGLRATLEKAIDEEFRKAKEKLDAINVAETLKKPLREMMETLNGRKK